MFITILIIVLVALLLALLLLTPMTLIAEPLERFFIKKQGLSAESFAKLLPDVQEKLTTTQKLAYKIWRPLSRYYSVLHDGSDDDWAEFVAFIDSIYTK